MSTDGSLNIDLERLPFEITRAVESTGIPLEWVEPGLYVRYDDTAEHLLIFEGPDTSEPLASVPTYRLLEPDLGRLNPYVEKSIRENYPVHVRDQLFAAANDGRADVLTPPDMDHVLVHIEGEKVVAVHRRCLVDGYPEADE